MYRKTLLVAIVLLASLASVWPLADVGARIAPTDPIADAGTSHRIIVELASPPLADWAAGDPAGAAALDASGRLDVSSPAARRYLAHLDKEQQLFLKAMGQAVPWARVATYLDEDLQTRQARFAIVWNGLAVDAGLDADRDRLERALAGLTGVRGVYGDYAHEATVYASVPLINAPALYALPEVGGMASAGDGIKVASMDGGIHHAGAMFDGEGYSYPPGYPLGYTANTNGKIIASRAYFRTWDPPTPGDEYPWPGTRGTSHGQHTASTMVGNPVEGVFEGTEVALAGVAPRAYAMSYRVFYSSVRGITSMYSTEGIAALEDIVRDGADVVNNSWGGGASSGGEGVDPLDAALLRAWDAGVFVAMSAGNAGSLLHTVDHPSRSYINVASSTTDGTFLTSHVDVTAPEPVSDTLIAMPMQTASFGGEVPGATELGPYDYLPAVVVSATNLTGCAPFPEDAFAGKVALISRGVCEFGLKAAHAEQAGAVAVIVHNDEARGDALVSMSGGEAGEQVTIPAVFVGYTNGMRLTDWYATHGEASELVLSTVAVQVGNTPDIIAGSSSRGPAVGYVLKPDVAAPGVNILAEGFANAEGEDRHLGFGQASGTSMAAPHVSGAAAILRQVHPDWSPAWIKSALMSTAQYRDVYIDGLRTQPAQPLDMGAGRIDLTNAADPGVILAPPNLSFGKVMTGTTASLTVQVTSVADGPETYTLSSVDVANGYTPTVEIAGLSFEPEILEIEPGATATITVTWDTTAAAHGYGDNQGYLLLDGETHHAHMPAWMRVGYTPADVDVLVIDNDGSSVAPEVIRAFYGRDIVFPDYTPYYTRSLENLNVGYEVLDVDPNVGFGQIIPEANWLQRYGAVVYQTGDFSAGVLTGADQHRLREYSNHGGAVVAFGQDLAAVFSSASTGQGTTFYQGYLGAEWLQDAINGEEVFTDTAQLIVGVPDQPFAGYAFDVSARGDGAGNQLWIDEIRRTELASHLWTSEDDTRPLLQYGSGGQPVEAGLVAIANRERPSLERPVVEWAGRNAYFAFGLEGVNSEGEFAPRTELLARALAIVLDEPTVVISPTVKPANEVTTFAVDMEDTFGGQPVSLRWDFGDGTPYTDRFAVRPPASPSYPRADAGHTYRAGGTYTVRVEATNLIGTRAIGELEIEVPLADMTYLDAWMRLFLPTTSRRAPLP